MSYVWNVMLSFSNEEYWIGGEEEPVEIPRAVEKINQWLEADKARNYGPLTNITSDVGEVGMTASVYGGGFKRFDIEAFIDVVALQEWRERHNVQLFVQGEESGRWTVLDFTEDTSEG